jgi:uncharacterized protein
VAGDESAIGGFMKYLDCIASVLLIIGGLNWGLVGLFDYNVVTALFSNPVVVKAVYGLIGLSALWQAYGWYRCKCCKCPCHTDKE